MDICIWSTDRSSIRREIVAEALKKSEGKPLFIKDLGALVGHMAGDPIPPDCLKSNKDFHSTKYRRLLSDDIDRLNRSTEFSYSIISDTNGVRICTEAECERLYAMERKEALKKLAKCAIIARKTGLNGQVSFTDEEINSFVDRSYIA